MNPDTLASIFLIGAVSCAVLLLIAFAIAARGSRPQSSYHDYDNRGVTARLRSVARHRLQQLRELSPAELQALPARQRETKRSFNGRKFHLHTSRTVLADGSLRLTVEAVEPGWLWSGTRVTERCVLPGIGSAGRDGLTSVIA
ncbi:MAG: hypothetical protein HY301_08420 [Verrucomicrobia bacterium]|nr:hypothetical protein [Verrucomicrobiota bacterium]